MSARTPWRLRIVTLVTTIAAVLIIGAIGCAPDGAGQQQLKLDVDAGPVAPTLVGEDGARIVRREQLQSGPTISGSLQARERAVLRAEVGGTVTRVHAELGDTTKKGQVLARIDDRASRDAFLSARSASTSAEQEVVLARRQLERTQRLVDAGALAQRDLEVAQSSESTAQAQLADARARLSFAGQTLADATVRAPFDGVISERAVNTGDVVVPGTSLFTVIDPSTMRLTASVPSDEIAAIAVGKPVTFNVRGYPEQTFTGTIERTAPAADPTTRQVAVLVAIPNSGGRLIAGLFAEGRVAAVERTALVIPEGAVDDSAGGARVLRATDGRVEEVTVQLGLRDRLHERVEVTSGLSAGDIVLVGGARTLPPGTVVELARSDGFEGAPVGR